MPENLVAVTKKSSMQPLAFQGIMAYESFAQIREMLRRKFDDDYALLFTKPVENKADDDIDWYSSVQGEARPLSDLPEDEAAPMRERIATMAREIRDYAEELIKTGEPLKITRGNILRLALVYPDPDFLYVIGGQPVFIGWGFAPGTPGVEPCELFKLIPAKPKPKTPDPEPEVKEEPTIAPEPAAETPREEPAKNPPPPPAASPAGCLWWLPVLPLLALLLFLLFAGIGNLGALSGYSLFDIPAPAWLKNKSIPDAGEIDRLRAEIADYRHKINEKAAMCVPERHIAEKPVQPPAVEKPIEELVIPKNATKADFLSGRWLCETGLVNARTNEPVKVEFSFDSDGVGRAITVEQNDRCQGN
ncbi:MAG: hypothetical protein HDQ93_02985, partial [Desulfovibrio sp.]|nr:hypothetical protein [Desulfovibrio sp.]